MCGNAFRLCVGMLSDCVCGNALRVCVRRLGECVKTLGDCVCEYLRVCVGTL